VGYKWSLSGFCKHLENAGIDTQLLWSRIYDVIIKSILAGEHYVNAALKKNNLHRNNCFEIFGYDILLDSDLKPWLMEVNLSPSLATESPLDMTIKANLLADAFNLIGVKQFDRRKESMNKIQNRAKAKQQSVRGGGFGPLSN
jgi:tubulin polyglutamylase TTLL5